MNRILFGLVMSAMTMTVSAQSNSDSPYSQYGLGDLSSQGTGFNKGMNGVGVAMRKGYEVNPINPASYSAVDSMTMIFDAGLSGQITNFEESGKHLNGKSAGFDYAVGLFRLFKHVGVSFGIQPYSNIGYKYYTSSYLSDIQANVTTTYSGSGGLNQLFVGAGWNIIKPLSVGFNISYLWGEYDKSIATSSTTAMNTLSKDYTADISSYKLDLGIQYELKINSMNSLTLGATWSPGHSLKSSAYSNLINNNSSISKADTTTFEVKDALSIPTTFGLGLSYTRSNTLRAGVDVLMQKWGSVDFPDYQGDTYVLKSGLLKDSYRLNAGAEWTPRVMSRRFFERVRYRLGVGYSTPYYYINGQEGPKELSASIGFGIPIINGYNNRSVLNISGQYVHRSADNLITENTFRINIGLTFNERWFAKWKVE